jgi:hypothetical protein
MDLRDAIAHGPNLGLTHGVIQGMDLPVDVGFGYMVQVDQGDLTHPAAREGLSGP